MRILIAEDERITRRMLQRQIERWGHEVVVAEDGLDAWERFQQQQFDIVVTDWDMPRLDGRKLLERIRGDADTRYVYLIMLTARTEKSDLVAGMESGADDFLAKPFDRNELRVRLNAGKRIIELERTLAAKNDALVSANTRMSSDLEAAALMQQDLLPKDLPTLATRFAWHFEPCDELGGDILNVMPLDETNVALYLLDVTGHGVPAALLSVTLHRVLSTEGSGSTLLTTRDAAGEHGTITPPSGVAEDLNRMFPMDNRTGRFFTLAYAVLDEATGVLRYMIAGHPQPILVRQGQPAEHMPGRGLPIGVFDEPNYEEQVVQLKPGDRVYFYSDGITEARNAVDDMLDPAGLLELIDAARSGTLENDLSECMRSFKEWCGSVPLGDDTSVLALEIPGHSG